MYKKAILNVQWLSLLNVQWLSQVKKLNQKPCVLILRRNLVGLELASQRYQWILQEESHTIGLLSFQINMYKMVKKCSWLVVLWIFVFLQLSVKRKCAKWLQNYVIKCVEYSAEMHGKVCVKMCANIFVQEHVKCCW